jgi:hypothetical protein
MAKREITACDYCGRDMTALEQEKLDDKDICDVCITIYREMRDKAWKELGEKYDVGVQYTVMFSEVLAANFKEEEIKRLIGDKGLEAMKAVKDICGDPERRKAIEAMANPEPEPDIPTFDICLHGASDDCMCISGDLSEEIYSTSVGVKTFFNFSDGTSVSMQLDKDAVWKLLVERRGDLVDNIEKLEGVSDDNLERQHKHTIAEHYSDVIDFEFSEPVIFMGITDSLPSQSILDEATT